MVTPMTPFRGHIFYFMQSQVFEVGASSKRIQARSPASSQLTLNPAGIPLAAIVSFHRPQQYSCNSQCKWQALNLHKFGTLLFAVTRSNSRYVLAGCRASVHEHVLLWSSTCVTPGQLLCPLPCCWVVGFRLVRCVARR